MLEANEVEPICNRVSHSSLKPYICFTLSIHNGFSGKKSISKSKAFILSISARNLQQSNMSLGTLSVSNLWKHLCGNTKTKVCHKQFFLFTNKLTWVCDLLLCSKLTVHIIFPTSIFQRNNSYPSFFYIGKFQYAELKLDEKFLIAANSSNTELIHSWKQVQITYDWEQFKRQYKVFFNKEYFSWIDAQQKCKKSNLTLPSFHSHKHLTRVVTFIWDHYNFQPTALLVGQVHGVRMLFCLKYRSLALQKDSKCLNLTFIALE